MRYSRKQILEAIKYWENVLVQMNESKSPLLTKFENIFGIDAVYQKKLTIDINLKNILCIFNILNVDIFNGNLKLINNKLDLYCGDETQLLSILKSQFKVASNYTISDKLALFHPLLQWLYNKQTKKPVLVSIKNGIFINTDCGSKATLPYLISTICHEMIHCYDCLYGHLLQMTQYCILHGCVEDEISDESHFTPIFKEKSKMMKDKNGITIHNNADGKSFEDFNIMAAEEIQVLKESDDLSMYRPIVFSDEFKNKYKNLITFCTDGNILLTFS